MASNSITKKLLILGPTPPPIGGSPLTVQAILKELSNYPIIEVRVINTSPTLDIRKEMTGFNLEKVCRLFKILREYIYHLYYADVVLVFANNLFVATIVPLLLLFARIFHKRFYIKPVGAGLDLFIASHNKMIQSYILHVLQSTDGILAQTSLLRDTLINWGCKKTHYLPGCRPALLKGPVCRMHTEEFRLIFLAHLTRAKGPLVLLQALKILAKTCPKVVICDFYGPIHDDIREEFLHDIEAAPYAAYRGVVTAGEGSQIIREYDTLVLPSFFDQEGHPGVLIEAMHAGVPVIVTKIRSISDLVVNEENGLIVPMRDPYSLAQAIQQLAENFDLRKKMSEASYRKGREFSADVVVRQLINIVYSDIFI